MSIIIIQGAICSGHEGFPPPPAVAGETFFTVNGIPAQVNGMPFDKHSDKNSSLDGVAISTHPWYTSTSWELCAWAIRSPAVLWLHPAIRLSSFSEAFMLEQQYQIDAFNAQCVRKAGGLTPPDSATLYRSAVKRINQLVSELSALLPETITYPPSLAGVISTLDGITEDLTDAATLFEAVIELIESNADVATPQAVLSLVNSVSTSDPKFAFTILNHILIAVGTAHPADPGAPVVIPEDLLDDVSDAVEAFAEDTGPYSKHIRSPPHVARPVASPHKP